jgi:hypothetical protein
VEQNRNCIKIVDGFPCHRAPARFQDIIGQDPGVSKSVTCCDLSVLLMILRNIPRVLLERSVIFRKS